jgi:hypothetical protein
MDKYQVRSCISGSGSITYDPDTGVIGGGGGGGATWGSITGTLSSQTDLQTALDAKQNESIVINSNTTAVIDGVYTVVASATFTDPTPAEGKGFMVFVRNGTATVGGTGYSTAGTVINRIYHSGAWANYTLAPTSLAIGTTAITSGTVGRILFEGAGNVLQQAANIFWDNTNSRLSLGFGSSPSARLDILAASTSGSNLALRVRDNGNAFNQFTVYDSGVAKFSAVASTGLFVGYRTNFGRNWVFLTTQDISTDISNPTLTAPTLSIKSDFIAVGSGVGATYSDIVYFDRKYIGSAHSSTWALSSCGSTTGNGLALTNGAGDSASVFVFEPTGNSYFYAGNRFHQFTNNGTGTMRIASGTAPTSTFADSACIYVNDISAGNAAFHTRAEGSHIFYAGENVGMRSNHDLKLAANNTVYLTMSTAGLFTYADATNMAFNATTGTKIGTATSQKLAFWNKTPIVQPTTAITGATFASPGAGTNVKTDDTFGGYTLQQIAAALINTGILA